MIAKLAWRIFTQPDNLCALILQAKYFNGSTFLSATPQSTSSWMWKGILKVQDIIVQDWCFIPRCCSQVDLRNDPWLPWHPQKKPTWRTDDPSLQVVADLVVSNRGLWNSILVRALFEEESAKFILQLLAPRPDQRDQIIWTDDPQGEFSVKSVVSLQKARRCPPHLQLNKSSLVQNLEA